MGCTDKENNIKKLSVRHDLFRITLNQKVSLIKELVLNRYQRFPNSPQCGFLSLHLNTCSFVLTDLLSRNTSPKNDQRSFMLFRNTLSVYSEHRVSWCCVAFWDQQHNFWEYFQDICFQQHEWHQSAQVFVLKTVKFITLQKTFRSQRD